MIPLMHKDSAGLPFRLKEQISGWKRHIFSNKKTRNIFLFLILNLSFAFIELTYGYLTNSLGLIMDSFHMFFDCTGLVLSLAAAVITKWRSNDKFSYGYVRAEILAGLINGLLLFFIAFSIASKAIMRLFQPPDVEHDRLLLVSVLGFLVNIMGLYVFQEAHEHCHGHSHSHNHGNKCEYSHSHSGHTNILNHNHFYTSGKHEHHDHHDIEVEVSYNSGNTQIMQGVYQHILADIFGSVGVIISVILMQYFGWMIADPICSLLVSVLIIYNVYGLLKESMSILMQRQPKELDSILPHCYNKVTQLAGVYSVQDPHFWTLCSENYVGCLKLEVARTVDPKYIVATTQMIFQHVGITQLTVQLDYSTS